MSVFVTDSDSRQVLAIIRSLGKRGIAVSAGESRRTAMGFFSKYCTRKVLYPPPVENPELFKRRMLEYVAKHKIDVFMPVSNPILVSVSRSLDEFSKHTSVPIPSSATLMKALDKALTGEFSVGIPQPVTLLLKKHSEISQIAKETNYPVVIKPRISSGSRGIKYASNANELVHYFKVTAEKYGIPLIQEYIPGDEIYGVSALLNMDSKVRASFVHKRVRQFPLTGGPSTYRVSVSNRPIAEIGIRLLEQIGWQGVAMVEFKVDPRDGTPKLMEVNPRFWGSLSLAIEAGIDFPHLLYRMAIDGDVHPVFNYKTGVKQRFMLFGDIFHFLASRNKLKLMPEFLKIYEEDLHYDIWKNDDMLPAFVRMINGFRYVWSREMWDYSFTRA
jgi:predicted ATP-grasp superfamily ATP-dependent carboligase